MHLQAVVKRALRDSQTLKRRQQVRRVEFQGIMLRIDRPAGYVQTGKDEAGRTWERTFKTDYGYIPRTKGGDGDGLDVYLGPDPHASLAYWVSQRKPTGAFDEYKLMLGFHDRRAARAMWSAHTPEKFYGGIATTSMGMVKSLLGVEPVSIAKALDSMVTPDPTDPVLGGVSASDGSESDQLLARIEKRSGPVRLAKADEEQRYVLGVVLEPDIVDAQGDTYDAPTIERAAHLYMARFRNRGLMHDQLVNHLVEIVESYVAPCDMQFGPTTVSKGTWLAAFVVHDDELWNAVKSGRLGGLSIGGTAMKVDPVTGDVIQPPPELARYSPS